MIRAGIINSHSRRLVLIGHSGAGKSSCLRELGIDTAIADMDATMGAGGCPTLIAAIEWLTNPLQPIVVVLSNHEILLEEMLRAKKTGRYADQFAGIVILYLRCSKQHIAANLAKSDMAGHFRERSGVQYTLENFPRLDLTYAGLADRTLECSGRSLPSIASEIEALLRYERREV